MVDIVRPSKYTDLTEDSYSVSLESLLFTFHYI